MTFEVLKLYSVVVIPRDKEGILAIIILFMIRRKHLPIIFRYHFVAFLHDKKESFMNWRRLEGERERNTNSAACLWVHLYADDRGGGRCTDGRTLSEGRRQSSSTETLRARRTTETTRSFTLDTDSRR